MKNYFIYMSIIFWLAAGCSSNQNKEHDHQDGTHTHEDGSVHKDHVADTTKQEEFVVPADSTSEKEKSTDEHSHDGHEHPHR